MAPVTRLQAKAAASKRHATSRPLNNRTSTSLNSGTSPSLNNGAFRFMDLPGELRNLVYKFVIDDVTRYLDGPVVPDSIRLGKCTHPYPSRLERRYVVPQKFSPHEMERMEKVKGKQARKDLAACRLGDVCHAVRNEFVPLLWAAQRFGICTCAFETIATDGTPRPLLASNIKHLVFHSHWESPAPYCDTVSAEVRRLAHFLAIIQFNKGRLTLCGDERVTNAIYEGLCNVSWDLDLGYTQLDAIDRAVETCKETLQATMRQYSRSLSVCCCRLIIMHSEIAVHSYDSELFSCAGDFHARTDLPGS